MASIKAVPITAAAFAPFGDVLDTRGLSPKTINAGKCKRFHNLAGVDVLDGQVGISMFRAELRSLPYSVDLLERHPLGSQAFIPCSPDSFLVIVAQNSGEDSGGEPVGIKAFITAPYQGINLHRNVWHGVLTPLAGSGVFAVIDYIGEQDNLVEYVLDTPVLIVDDE